MDRSYDHALALLDKLAANRKVVDLFSQPSSSPAAAPSIPSAARPSAASLNSRAIPEMQEWLRRGGISATDLAQRLRCIHIAGTKGKGSVCAYTTSLLLQQPERAGRVGTFTSPHLVSVRERIALDGQPLSQALFARYFFEVWDRFEAEGARLGEPDAKPFFFRFLTVMALHVFLAEGVRSAVIECGIGGEYDSTNVLPPEAVSAAIVTQLGIDHVAMLGDTVEKIAWHKAGILKKGVMGFTRCLDSKPGVMNVLRTRAEDNGAQLVEVGEGEVEAWGGVSGGLMEGDFQKYNQALAVLAVQHHLRMKVGLDAIDERFVVGLKKATIRGRHERLERDNVRWFLDGAHTTDSLAHVGAWFGRQMGGEKVVYILVFNQQERNVAALLESLLRAMQSTSSSSALGVGSLFDHAILTRNDQTPPRADEAARDLTVQQRAAEALVAVSPGTACTVVDNIESAAEHVRKIAAEAKTEGKEVRVLGTGSMYIVGGLLKALEPESLL